MIRLETLKSLKKQWLWEGIFNIKKRTCRTQSAQSLTFFHSSSYFSLHFVKPQILFAMSEKTRYSDDELKEFEELILEKLEKAREEFNTLKDSLTRQSEDTGDNFSSVKTLEDGADTAEKEQLSQLAGRQQKFIKNLENALVRIKNGTYGICVDTGKLISKERLKAVPHTTQSIDAKLNRF